MPDRMQEDIDDKMLTWKLKTLGPARAHRPAKARAGRAREGPVEAPAQVLGYQGTYVTLPMKKERWTWEATNRIEQVPLSPSLCRANIALSMWHGERPTNTTNIRQAG